MNRLPLPLKLLVASLVLLATNAALPGTAHPALLHDQRRSGSDLEIGEGKSAPAKFITYKDLLKLPQATYTVSDDTNFPPNTQISGVPLSELAAAVGAPHASNLIVAICNDKYRASYPPEYIAAHHPLLVLKINGKPPTQWPKSHDGGPMGPYLISHPPFKPSFHILSHADEAQIPYGVVRIEFRSQAEVYGAIRPTGNYATNSPVWQGYRIARQNCYRCHNMGPEGGQMARHPWPVLAAWAAYDPKYFAQYVRNPRSVGADRTMPAMTRYDDKTIDALRAYFATFATSAASEARSRP
jgi:mono/diheme cytochrome c family protein